MAKRLNLTVIKAYTSTINFFSLHSKEILVKTSKVYKNDMCFNLTHANSLM